MFVRRGEEGRREVEGKEYREGGRRRKEQYKKQYSSHPDVVSLP